MLRTNVLLITADDLNYNSTGVYGSKVPRITPHIDKLAAEGLRFEHAHVTIAVCQPSRSVLMTGRYPHRNGALGFEPIDAAVPTLSEQFAREGYYNGIIGKETHLQPKEKFGWDEYVRTMGEENGFGRDPEAYYRHTKRFLENAEAAGKPFFLMANSHDPHRPFAGSEIELGQFGKNTSASKHYSPEEIEVPGFLPDLPDVRQELSEYFTSVHRCDETVGAILRALRESGREEDTLVMFLSDNGMAFPFAKTNCYLNSTRTPWIVRWPGKVKPGSVDREHIVSGIDFMPTALEAAGLPVVEGMDGTSFIPILSGLTTAGRDEVFTVFNRTVRGYNYPMRCLQNKQYGYIYNAWSDQETVFRNESQSGLTFKAMKRAAASDASIADRVKLLEYRVKEEFYDFAADPNALRNLIDEPEHRERIRQMRRKLLRSMQASNDFLSELYDREIVSAGCE